MIFFLFCGPGSVVGTANGYGLDGPGIESAGVTVTLMNRTIACEEEPLSTGTIRG